MSANGSNAPSPPRLPPLVEIDLPARATRIYLVRHVQSQPVGEPHAMDPGVTELGTAQLGAVRDFFRQLDVDVIVTSELVRARETANAIREAHRVDIVVDPTWNEFHTVGAWRDLPREEVADLICSRFYKPDQRQAIGESLRDLYARTRRAWDALLRLSARNIVLVGHNAVLGTIIAAAFGLREDSERHSLIAYPHGGVSELWSLDTAGDPTLPNRVTMVRYLCYAEHLKPRLLSY